MPCAICESPITSVIGDGARIDDETASVIIIGGGPHAMAALAALHEGSLAFQQFNEGFYQSRIGFGSLEKAGNGEYYLHTTCLCPSPLASLCGGTRASARTTPMIFVCVTLSPSRHRMWFARDTVCVIDPGSHFNESWNARFDALEIGHLRSPALAHPMAFEPTALVSFAIREGRTSELIEPPLVGKWLVTTDESQQESLLKAKPTTALFRDFCASLEARLPHRWLSGTATHVCKDTATGKFNVHYATAIGRERRAVARAVVLATGAVGQWRIPRPFEAHRSSRLVIHTEELLAPGNGTLPEEIARRCAGASSRVLVVGGGISAAQAALAACRAGRPVVLRSRRPLQTRAYDIAQEWLDARHADRLRFEFWSLPVEERREAIRKAMAGGSVPASYMEELRVLSQSTCGATEGATSRSDNPTSLSLMWAVLSSLCHTQTPYLPLTHWVHVHASIRQGQYGTGRGPAH